MPITSNVRPQLVNPFPGTWAKLTSNCVSVAGVNKGASAIPAGRGVAFLASSGNETDLAPIDGTNGVFAGVAMANQLEKGKNLRVSADGIYQTEVGDPMDRGTAGYITVETEGAVTINGPVWCRNDGTANTGKFAVADGAAHVQVTNATWAETTTAAGTATLILLEVRA